MSKQTSKLKNDPAKKIKEKLVPKETISPKGGGKVSKDMWNLSITE